MTARVGNITLDCDDVLRMATLWSTVLNVHSTEAAARCSYQLAEPYRSGHYPAPGQSSR
jgi:hypothetical protein